MPSTTACTPNCCTTVQTVNVPGSTGSSGVNGTNGIDAFTLTTQDFTVPAIGSTAGVSVQSSVWMVIGQQLILGAGSSGIGGGPANFKVTAISTTTSCTLQFLGYPGDVAPGATISAGAVVSPSGIMGGGWNILPKTSDQTIINSATLTNDTALQFYMQANTKYRIRGTVFFDTTAAGDFKYDFTAPAAPTLVRFERIDCVAGGTPAERALDVATPGSTSLAGAGTTGGYVKFDAIFQNGANADAFAFQFAQDTATNDTGAIVRAGSWVEWSTS